MKKRIILTFLSVALLLGRCSLVENPAFLSNESVYGHLGNAQSAVNGIYDGMAQGNLYGNQYVWITNIHSGFMVTKRMGNDPTSYWNSNWTRLRPVSNEAFMSTAWQGLYRTINFTNNAIHYVQTYDVNSTSATELGFNDVAGHAYLVRGLLYFNLVRLWGEVPLRIDLPSAENIDMAVSPEKDIYAQIISDAQNASTLINGAMGVGYPKQYAANMLLAKVYMQLATAPADVQNGKSSAEYWQLAYDEAKKVYGQYKLVNDYADLFHNNGNSDNTSESIFEIQFSVVQSRTHVKQYTPSNYISVPTNGWMRAHADVYDLHEATYPGDPRIASTFLGGYTKADGTVQRGYPDPKPRPGGFGAGFPYIFKYALKDQSATLTNNDGNYIIFRYADLLLMLAEISNELQNGEQLGYVTEVLDRVGMAPQAGYMGDQASFRDAIMKEYQFELLAEGHDWFNYRRRGYDYFLKNVIEPHNYFVEDPDGIFNHNKDYDLEFFTDESMVMHLPIPDDEIRVNGLIN